MVQPDASRIWTRDTHRDLRWYCPSSMTSIDEFNDDSLDAAWVRVDPSGASSRMDVTEADDCLHVRNNGGDSSSQLHAVVRPLSGVGGSLSAGDAIVTAFTPVGKYGTNYTMFGIVLSDGTTHGSGTQIAAMPYIQSSGFLAGETWPFTNWTTPGTPDTGLNIAGSGQFMYLRLVKLTSNVWRTDYSMGGRLWLSQGAGVTLSFTPTHVGVLSSSWGTSNKSQASYEFLRRVSGVS